ncbi:MAG: hypothetical protein ABIJ39_13795 [Chloroflexota bacterium]
MNAKTKMFSFMIIGLVLLSACGLQPTATPLAAATVDPASQNQGGNTGSIWPQSALDPLPAEAQRVEFQAEDGTQLVGRYYPAKANPAPVVVLMHWAGGSMTDWERVGMVAWLANRSGALPDPVFASQTGGRFDTPYGFPVMPGALSFNVFIFDFRNFGESEQFPGESFADLAPGWLMDARAAYAVARTLPGADANRVVGIGASIGADAVVDACGDGCIGAFSISPGDFLAVEYRQAVRSAGQTGRQVWCVASVDDPASAQACQGADAPFYRQFIYNRGGHGMELFMMETNLRPSLGQYLLDFLIQVFGIS